jgi:hypothetical protein
MTRELAWFGATPAAGVFTVWTVVGGGGGGGGGWGGVGGARAPPRGGGGSHEMLLKHADLDASCKRDQYELRERKD